MRYYTTSMAMLSIQYNTLQFYCRFILNSYRRSDIYRPRIYCMISYNVRYIRLLQLQFLIVDVIRVLTYVNKQSGYLDPVVSEFFGAGPRFRDSIYSRSDPEIYLQNRSLIKFTSPFSCIKPKINKWLYSYIYIIVIYSQLNVCLDLGEIKIIIIIIEIE